MSLIIDQTTIVWIYKDDATERDYPNNIRIENIKIDTDNSIFG